MGGRIVLIDSYLVDQIHLKIKSKIFIMCLLQGIKKDLVCQVSAIFYLWIISVTVIAYHTINMWKLQCWHLWLFRKVVQLCKNNVGSFCKTLQFYKVTLKWPLNYDGSARWATPSFIFWLLFFHELLSGPVFPGFCGPAHQQGHGVHRRLDFSQYRQGNCYQNGRIQ